MDSLITAAARALAAGDPLGALNRVALRDDAPALALRGIAMAQLGDLGKARQLLRRASRAFSPRETLARARCVVAEAEIALAMRELGRPSQALTAARQTLERLGDRTNATQARLVEARRLLLTGQISAAEDTLQKLRGTHLPPALLAARDLLIAGIAMRRLHAKAAKRTLASATQAAREAGIPALMAEVEHAAQRLRAPAARLISSGNQRSLLLEDVETLQQSVALVVDACCHVVRDARGKVSLARRPVLFLLARMLGESWPDDVAREALIAGAFSARRPDETHRARLRVEIGRLRSLLRAVASVHATPRGFALAPRNASHVIVLAHPVDQPHSAVLACLSDGQAWSSSALALALGISQRTVQRALETLATGGKLQCLGKGRARRWTSPPLPGLTTTLLLPAPIPGG